LLPLLFAIFLQMCHTVESKLEARTKEKL
jgi:hypothetical protein